MSLLENIGYLFVYLFVFGINDLIIKKCCKTEKKIILYYIIIAFIAMIIFYNVKK